MWVLDCEEGWAPKNWCFWTVVWYWRRLLRVPWTARRSNQSILKEICPGISLKGMMLKLKLQYFGHLMWRVDSLEDSDASRDWEQEEKGTTEDEMAGWHHWLNGHETEWTLGVGDGQGYLACCGPRESDMTERLNWNNILIFYASTPDPQKLSENHCVFKITKVVVAVLMYLKAQHSENEYHDIWSHHFMGNRWENSGNSVRL